MSKELTPTKLIEILQTGKTALKGYGVESPIHVFVGKKRAKVKDISVDLNYGAMKIIVEEE